MDIMRMWKFMICTLLVLLLLVVLGCSSLEAEHVPFAITPRGPGSYGDGRDRNPAGGDSA
jgi:hypothetical protein